MPKILLPANLHKVLALKISGNKCWLISTCLITGLDEGDLALIHSVVSKGRQIPGDCGDEYRWAFKNNNKALIEECLFLQRFSLFCPYGVLAISLVILLHVEWFLETTRTCSLWLCDNRADNRPQHVLPASTGLYHSRIINSTDWQQALQAESCHLPDPSQLSPTPPWWEVVICYICLQASLPIKCKMACQRMLLCLEPFTKLCMDFHKSFLVNATRTSVLHCSTVRDNCRIWPYLSFIHVKINYRKVCDWFNLD